MILYIIEKMYKINWELKLIKKKIKTKLLFYKKNQIFKILAKN